MGHTPTYFLWGSIEMNKKTQGVLLIAPAALVFLLACGCILYIMVISSPTTMFGIVVLIAIVAAFAKGMGLLSTNDDS